jgi:hypothetical protein
MLPVIPRIKCGAGFAELVLAKAGSKDPGRSLHSRLRGNDSFSWPLFEDFKKNGCME